MATRKRQTVDQWLESVTAEVIDNKHCSAITLLHLKGVGGATEEVATKPLEGTINPSELANFFVGRAEGFSQDLPGIQTFKLLAFYGTNEPHNPFHFTTSDGTVMSRSESVMSAHEPTPTGLLGQLMKTLEVKDMRLQEAHMNMMSMAQGIMTMCFGPHGLIQGSVRSQLEAVEVVKDAMLDMHKERKQLVLEEHKAAQDLQMRKAIIDAIPHFANRLSGREIFDEGMNDTKILKALAHKITPQDMELLVAMGKMSKEEAMVLSGRFAAIVEQDRKDAEALKTVPSEENTPQSLAPTKGNGQL